MSKEKSHWGKSALVFAGAFISAYLLTRALAKRRSGDSAQNEPDTTLEGKRQRKDHSFDRGPLLKNRTHDDHFDRGAAYKDKMSKIDPTFDQGPLLSRDEGMENPAKTNTRNI